METGQKTETDVLQTSDEILDNIVCGDCLDVLEKFESDYFHLILSDIPYGICYDEWDVIHNNTNSALLGASPAQKRSGTTFRHRGKPLNGWSEADRKISTEYYEWCSRWAKQWLRVVKPGASVFVFAGRRLAHRCITAMEDVGFTFRDMIAVEKEVAPHRAQRVSVVYDRRGDRGNAKRWEGWRLGNLRPIFEPVLWFSKPYKIGGTIADNLIDNGVGAFNDMAWKKYSSSSSNLIKVRSLKTDHGLHPTQKPIHILKALIELATRENQIVLDPFCGSGSTLVAAKMLGRRYVGIEKSQDYYSIAKKRLQEGSRVE